MATQPTEVAQWCLDDQDANSNSLKVAPPAQVIQTGLLPQSPFARIWLNYYLNNFSENLQFINDEVLGVGSVLQFVDTEEPDFANDFEGTWVNIGNQVIGSVTVNYWRRTA